MGYPRMSFKKLKELCTSLGGGKNGFFITAYGNDINTGKNISQDNIIAIAPRPNASYDYYLVQGKVFEPKKY